MADSHNYMSLKDTSLIIQAAPLPLTFEGNPNEFLAAMVQRMRVVSPNGANFIFIGDVAPTTNVGPWLKGGTQWYVVEHETSKTPLVAVERTFAALKKFGKV